MTQQTVRFERSENLRTYVRFDGVEAHETDHIRNSPDWRLKNSEGYVNGFLEQPKTPTVQATPDVPEFTGRQQKSSTKKGGLVIESTVE